MSLVFTQNNIIDWQNTAAYNVLRVFYGNLKYNEPSENKQINK